MVPVLLWGSRGATAAGAIFFILKVRLVGKMPAFPLYAADFDMDTNTWTNDEVGVYLRLLLSQWVNGPLPNDTKKLAKIVRISPKKFQNVFNNISHKFHKNGDNLLYNKRLEEERKNKVNYLEHQAKVGREGAEKRWGKQ